MYKNQLQELAQRSCFNLPSYACIREGPDHAPRFKATVNFNGEIFEGPTFFSTLRQAEHAAAEVALNTLAERSPSRTLAAKVLDETGVYKNMLQETAHRAGLNLPVYTTMRSGPGHVPVFSSTVELGGMSFTGELAKTKKQAQKNAAMSAWCALKQMSQFGSSPTPLNSISLEEQEQVVVARFLATRNRPESSDLLQSNPPKGHPRQSTTSQSSFPSTSSSVDSYYQNWASSSFTPDFAAYHIWLQEKAVEHHCQLMGLGVSIPTVPPPRPVFPWMHPLWHPSNNPHCLTMEQKRLFVPPLYFPNQLVQDPIKTRSMATIQEIPTKNQGDTSKFSPSEASVITQDSDIMIGKIPEDGKVDISSQNDSATSKGFSRPASGSCKSSGAHHGKEMSQNPLGDAIPKGKEDNSHQNEDTVTKGMPRHASSSCTRSEIQRGDPKLRNLAWVESSRFSPNIRPAPTSSQITPVVGPTLTVPRIPCGVRSFSPRPMLGRMQGGGCRARFMAPAVQIRSVVPVCSAAPPRTTKSFSGQEKPSTDDLRNPTASTSNVSSVSSNLGNLCL